MSVTTCSSLPISTWPTRLLIIPQIAQTAVTTGTRMFVNSLARERYPINYVHGGCSSPSTGFYFAAGFDSEGFSYFLTTQMRQTSPSPYHSKLVSHLFFLLLYLLACSGSCVSWRQWLLQLHRDPHRVLQPGEELYLGAGGIGQFL